MPANEHTLRSGLSRQFTWQLWTEGALYSHFSIRRWQLGTHCCRSAGEERPQILSSRQQSRPKLPHACQQRCHVLQQGCRRAQGWSNRPHAWSPDLPDSWFSCMGGCFAMQLRFMGVPLSSLQPQLLSAPSHHSAVRYFCDPGRWLELSSPVSQPELHLCWLFLSTVPVPRLEASSPGVWASLPSSSVVVDCAGNGPCAGFSASQHCSLAKPLPSSGPHQRQE